MRIEPSGLTPTGGSASEKSAAAGAAGANGAAGASAAGTSGGDLVSLPIDTGFVPSTELSNLTQRAKAEPEIRHHRIREVAQRLAQGHYSTAQSASQTAAAILNGGD
ncbi:MAG TPA: hypothetical protein VHR72_07440 [Gemmataceae bacterium]|jgi:hypothetical protein|nr:hypothetical protein [Gemmataceae bacterium]